VAVTVTQVVTVRLGLGLDVALDGAGALTGSPVGMNTGTGTTGRCDQAMIRAATTSAQTAMKSTSATVPSLPLMACP
jgi:hypothetical protein